MSPQYERLNRWIDQLQAGQHPEVAAGDGPDEIALLQTASELAGLRPGADEPDPAFLARLRSQILAETVPNGAGTAPGAGHVAGSAAPPAPLYPLPTPAAAAPALAAATAPPADPAVIRPVHIWERGVTRRSVLSGLGTMAAGLVAGLGLGDWLTRQEVVTAEAEAAEYKSMWEDALNSPSTPAGTLSPTQGRWFAVAQLNEVKLGEAIPIKLGEANGYLLRTGAEEFTALSASCTHMGCPVSWISASRTFNCHCHGASFDTTGRALTGPALYRTAIRNLPVFSWKIQDDVVYVLA